MRLALLYPAYRSQVHGGHLFQVANLHAISGKGNQIMVGMADSAFLAHSRNSLLHTAVHGPRESDWALFSDSDTYTTDVVSLIRMVNEGGARNAAVIAAPVKMRSALHGGPDYNAQIGEEYLPKERWSDQVIEVDRIGTALMAINCGWIREHWPAQPWFTVEFKTGEKPDIQSEDYWFCNEVKKRGGLILADGRVPVVHSGISDEVLLEGSLTLREI